jgi:hypothetical protein
VRRTERVVSSCSVLSRRIAPVSPSRRTHDRQRRRLHRAGFRTGGGPARVRVRTDRPLIGPINEFQHGSTGSPHSRRLPSRDASTRSAPCARSRSSTEGAFSRSSRNPISGLGIARLRREAQRQRPPRRAKAHAGTLAQARPGDFPSRRGRISAMRARREAMQARISSLRAVIAEVPPRLSAGIACRDENPARIPALQARRAAFSIENAEVRAPISSFRARRETVPARCAAKSRCKEALHAGISSLRARIAALQARCAEVPSRIAAMRPRSAALQSRAGAPTLRLAARRRRLAAEPARRDAVHAKEGPLPSGKGA